jgi:threonyl-tRNA synthetase
VDGPEKLAEALKACCPELAKKAIGLRVEGRAMDLYSPITSTPTVQAELIVADDSDRAALEMVRHSTAHLLAEAVRELYGESVQYTIGPALIDDFKYGFYYDFELPEAISVEKLPEIEKRMKKLASANARFVRSDVSVAEAKATFEKLGQRYKLVLIDDLVKSEGVTTVSLYQHGSFVDLCRGPHVPNTKFLKNFSLQAVAGAYWRGDAKNKMLTRIYGVAFFDEESLKRHLEKVVEAERRDHRVLGKQLDIYSVSEMIGGGLILWHPNGAIIRHTIEQFWIKEHQKRGYQMTYTPHIANEQVYKTSGHLEAYSEMMYAPMDIDGLNFRVKPMNCPGHIQIYNSQKRSYRDLPLRYCEMGTVYRYEPTGTLHGMLRVRGFTQDDAHIFCTVDQLAREIEDTVQLVDYMMKTFGYEYHAELATRPAKSIGTDDEWDWSTKALREVLERLKPDFTVEEGGGVFYGPKIQMMLVDSLGRQWQGPTIQVDLNLPQRFDSTYVGADNAEHRVVMVHRAVLGSMERFVGGLIEHYAGAFPLWLAPTQAIILPVSEKFNDYAESVRRRLADADIRVKVDLGDDKIGAKIRRAMMLKTPYMLVVGEREQQADEVSVRTYRDGDAGAMGVSAVVEKMAGEIKGRVR